MVVTVVMRWFWVKAVVMVRVIMVMRTMVTVVVEAVIGGESGDGDGYNGYAYDGDCDGRGGNRGDDGEWRWL